MRLNIHLDKFSLNVIHLSRCLTRIISIDPINDLIIQYSTMNLWEYSPPNNGCNRSAYDCESWDAYLKLITSSTWVCKHNDYPVAWDWEENSNIYEDDFPPYKADVFCIHFRLGMTFYIKVEKSNHFVIYQYMKSYF